MMLSEIRRFVVGIYVERRSYTACREVCERLPAYAEQVAAGRLPPEDRLVRQHLRACPLCGDIFDGLLETLGGREPPTPESARRSAAPSGMSKSPSAVGSPPGRERPPDSREKGGPWTPLAG